MKLVRKADLLLIAFLAIVPLAMLAGNAALALSDGEPRLVIYVDGKNFGRFRLGEDRTIPIGETNVCRIEGGRVRMTEADCPDLVCVHSASIGREGGAIACLPNKVILVIENAEGAGDKIDAVAS